MKVELLDHDNQDEVRFRVVDAKGNEQFSRTLKKAPLREKARLAHKSLEWAVAQEVGADSPKADVLPATADVHITSTHTHEEFDWYAGKEHEHDYNGKLIPAPHQHTGEIELRKDLDALSARVEERVSEDGKRFTAIEAKQNHPEHALATHPHPLIEAGLKALESELAVIKSAAVAPHEHRDLATVEEVTAAITDLHRRVSDLQSIFMGELASFHSSLEGHTHPQPDIPQGLSREDVQTMIDASHELRMGEKLYALRSQQTVDGKHQVTLREV